MPILLPLALVTLLPAGLHGASGPTRSYVGQGGMGQETFTVPALESEQGSIAGRILGPDGGPVADAEVILLEGDTGYPLGRSTHRSIFEQGGGRRANPLEGWWTADSGPRGAFRFEGVPVGSYRVVAQSWTPGDLRDEQKARAAGTSRCMNVAKEVHLRGFAAGVEVSANGQTDIELAPLGDRVFCYHRGAGNDDWYMALSLAPTSADPVLMFLGWRGDFARSAIGVIRMDAGEAVVRGLPPAGVHYAIFANDSAPAFGAGSFAGHQRRIHTDDQALVGHWSDARKAPPERLVPLVTELQRLSSEGRPLAAREALARGIGDPKELFRVDRSGGFFAAMFSAADLVGPLDRRLRLTEGGLDVTVRDLMAAEAYARLQPPR